MDKKYNFSYEPVSVYACAVDLVQKYSAPGAIHIDLGCGYAAISRKIEQAGARYIGFDANEDSVEALTSNGIEAYVLDLNDESSVISKLKTLCEGYSVVTISMLDVIEHLDYEGSLLSQIKQSFTSGQQLALVLSVPNTAHIDVAIKLMTGEFDYLDTGLLDKTHTVIYTEQNLSAVTRKNGWREVAANDYHLEFSEQFLLRPSLALNRDAGIGEDFRQMKGMLDPRSDVYQFVRAYVPDDALVETAPLRAARAVSVSLLLSEDVQVGEVSALISRLSSQHHRSDIQLLIPDILEEFIEGANNVKFYKASSLESFVKTSLVTSHWCYVNQPAEVCLTALAQLIEELDCSRGSPLVELVCAGSCASDPSQFELFCSIATNHSWRILIPEGYVREFGEQRFSGSTEEWSGLVRRAALVCGVRRMFARFDIQQSDPVVPIGRTAALGLVLNDPLSQMYIVRSGVWASAISDELQKLSAETLSWKARSELQTDELNSRHAQIEIIEAQLDSVLMSKSWRLTGLLRGMRRLMVRGYWRLRSVVSNPRAVLRPIYQKLPVLIGVRIRLRHFINAVRAKMMRAINSQNNLKAVQTITDRRFGYTQSSPVSDVQPLIDVSIVTYNSSKWVDGFFESLKAQDYPLQKLKLCFVDNGSKDCTVEALQRWKAQLGDELAGFDVIQGENVGFGLGHDRAIKTGDSEFVLISNIDIVFARHSITKVVVAANADTADAVGSWELRQAPYEHPKYYDPVTHDTNWSSHACILIRRSAYTKVGGYEHEIFMYGEDVELSYRLRSYGYLLKYCPSAVVYHYTYEHENHVKPIQFSGSTLANAYLRLRYGDFGDRFGGLVLQIALLFRPEAYAGARRDLIGNIGKIVRKAPHFLSGKGSSREASFPFRGFDYEMTRDGAFWSIGEPLEHAPLVTIVTRTYRNRNEFLRQAIISVLNQTYPNVELVVVEDGGETMKGLVGEFQSLGGREIRFYGMDKVGRSVTGNYGLEMAKGEYCMFLDDDDLLFSDHVEVLVAALSKNSQSVAAYSLAMEVGTIVGADGRYTEVSHETPSYYKHEYDYDILLDHNFIPIQSLLFQRALYLQRGGFETDMSNLEDWNLWLRYGYGNTFSYVAKTTSLFRTPADPYVRLERHKLLHEAYNTAKDRAAKSCEGYRPN